MTAPPNPGWADLRGSLPDHHTEIVTSHQGRPTEQVQGQRHGAGKPAPDHGAGEEQKYGGKPA
jgi:hypothetical protein